VSGCAPLIGAAALACAFWISATPARAQAPAASPGTPGDHGGHAAASGPAAAGAAQTPAQTPPGDEHAGHHPEADRPLPSFIRPITPADRIAAFPHVQGHTVHDSSLTTFILVDQVEWRSGSGRFSWDSHSWIGVDRDRLWLRTEGDVDERGVGAAQVHVLYGRAISRWWEVVAGVRQDVRPGPAQTLAAIGIQGLAPYWFEVEWTAYVGAGGQTHLRLETEYELLLTNRLALQPSIELELHGKDNPERRLAAGLSTSDIGLRLRYEIRREFAPYLGVVWIGRHFGTADMARAAGLPVGATRLVVGARVWY
jgi:copper resistance protein B